MIISLRELNKYLPNIKLDTTVEKAINNLGYEVEYITKFSDVSGVQFGKIIDVQKNVNSKNLSIVSLQLKDKIITIQTTAKNAKKGYFTVVFVEGSKKGDLTFSKKEIAGVVSEGMFAGYSELGFDSSLLPFDPEGIILLDKQDVSLEKDPIEAFELDDYIIDITTPANRPETNSYYILAMELAAYYKTDFKWYNLKPKDGYNFRSKLRVSKQEANELTFVEAKVNNSKTSLSDILFLAKHKISAKGIYPVDLTNITILVTGMPAHAYDKDKISGTISCVNYTGKVNILGNKDVEVNDVLAITDAKKVISLASVMGCEESSIDEKSSNIIFEVGVFNSKKIREAARQIKIESNSSTQGGKSLNSQIAYTGISFLKYRASLDGNLVSQIVNIPKVKKGRSVIQSRRKLAIYSNREFKDLDEFDDVEKTLKKIGFSMDKNRVIAPSYRNDIENYEDVIEEYFRFYGYDNFKPIAPFLKPYEVNRLSDKKGHLQSMGYNEIRTFTLISNQLNILNPFNFEENVQLMTFVSKEREVIRNSIITSMLESADYNIKRKINNLSLFEYGMINYNNFVYGLLSNQKDFFEMKQDICNFLKTDKLEFLPFKDNENIHPNVSAKIYHNNNFIGWIGKVSPKIGSTEFWVAEFKDIYKPSQITFNEYNSDPLKNIDLTFELNSHDNINSKIKEIEQVSDSFFVQQIDDYKHGNKRNVTLRITGTSEQIEKINNKFNK
ncbi:phenylalanine--tRNA ligase subunit beta [Mycoplasma tauri]|uniref:phenylalanine--tRNA ligase subunit beta n=1 Tax=Mycoplasma tauri TaxID=547987 RepID=UPI001CBD32F9|nr:phenylalanine--tRNA ligase subunit beta [Mycoplasma tauri]MBZ4203661.1 phenylalanine--tRNA ligase subunit beta [Mycoplasma tauri]